MRDVAELSQARSFRIHFIEQFLLGLVKRVVVDNDGAHGGLLSGRDER